jgi:hypothetical protein
VAAAEERAAELIRTAEASAAKKLKQAQTQLAELRAERDAIAEYIESLRSVVGEVVTKAPAQKPRAPRAPRAPRKATPKP